MKPKLIGLTGYAQSGKSTVAEYLSSNHSYDRVSFASRLKGMLGLGLGLTIDELYGAKKDLPCERLLGVTPRHAMQTLGTEWGRDMIHPDLWCSIALENIQRNKTAYVVIDDVRFVNEAELIHKAGGLVIRINRSITAASEHPSETSIDQIIPHTHIFNTGSMGNLCASIDDLMKGFVNV